MHFKAVTDLPNELLVEVLALLEVTQILKMRQVRHQLHLGWSVS